MHFYLYQFDVLNNYSMDGRKRLCPDKNSALTAAFAANWIQLTQRNHHLMHMLLVMLKAVMQPGGADRVPVTVYHTWR